MTGHYHDRQGRIIDFYRLFNLEAGASPEDIRRAFRSLIKKYHPDTAPAGSNRSADAIDLIIRGYHILIDGKQRRDYDSALMRERGAGKSIPLVVAKKRIRYSSSLGAMLRARILPRGMRRRDVINNFGQDIEIFVTPEEVRSGAVAYIQLPARMRCPLCDGRNAGCPLCHGTGRVGTSAQLLATIPAGVPDDTFLEVDLLKMRPDRQTSFCMRTLRIRILRMVGGSMAG